MRVVECYDRGSYLRSSEHLWIAAQTAMIEYLKNISEFDFKPPHNIPLVEIWENSDSL